MWRIIAAIVLSVYVNIAAAQQQPTPPTTGTQAAPPSPTTGMAERQKAPIGLRQPTQGDLPPSVLNNESPSQNENRSQRGWSDPLGPIPQICRKC